MIVWALLHWLSVAIAVNALLVLVAILDPVMWAYGFDGLALPIWNFYHNFCVQEHLYYLAGHPIALCQRNLAVFSSLLVGMVAFASVRRWLPPLSFWGYAVLMIPMALDGGTQLFGWRESTITLRTFTGVLFGLSSIWYLFPNIEAFTRRIADGMAPITSERTAHTIDLTGAHDGWVVAAAGDLM